MPGYSWNYFQPSVKMSSYLVAMVNISENKWTCITAVIVYYILLPSNHLQMVSDFIYVTSNPELSPGIQFKIWARSSFSDQTAYAAEIGPKILDDYVKKYFEIPFPLPKVDMAAIPDFAAGMFLFFFFIYSLFLNVRLSK